MPKKCLIYANCQGGGVAYFLNKSPFFQADYQVEYLINYSLLSEQKALPIEQLEQADLFIYQPVNQEHGVYCNDHVMTYLKDSCVRISFPYMYNNALWPFYHNSKKIVNGEPITNLLDAGASVVEVALKFLSLQIDFHFQDRFQNTLHILKEKESTTTLKVVPYILENYQSEKLFLTHNHPASALFIHCANQILSYLQYPLLDKRDYPHPNEASLPGYYSMTPYEVAHYQLAYRDNWRYFFNEKKQSRWQRFYLLHLMELILNRHPEKQRRYYYQKVVLKLLRSACKFLPMNLSHYSKM